jgi:hypothetical protein
MKKTMRRLIRTWKDCIDYRLVEIAARECGAAIKNGRGDHKMLRLNGFAVTYYTSHKMSIGVAREVFKFFLRAGAVALLVAGLILTA